jgi:hypothetical protein
VRLAIAGAAVPQIATFTGHRLRAVEAILDAHYLGRDDATKSLIAMVVCAVRYEPVSTANSLVTGKFTGNFAILRLLEVGS